MKRKALTRILSVLLLLALFLSLSACGKTIGTGGDKPAGGVVEVTKEASSDTPSSEKETKESKDTKDNKETQKETSPAAGSTNQETATNAGGSQTNNNTASNTGGGDTSSSGDSSQQPEQPPTQPPTEPPTEAPTQPPAQTWTISVTVDASQAGQGIFGGGTFTFYYQPTAFDALTATGLPYTGDSDYVSSINGLAHFDYGRLSGWLYAVNGWDPNVGCGSYYLNDGDYVYWHYTTDYTQEY